MNSTDSPLVSVVVATYHRIESLYRALESIAEQTCSRLEAIIVDDNADMEWNGKVESVINRVKSEHPSFSFIYIKNAENKGSGETRNIGIRSAQGEYITFLDDDDVYLPEKVEKQLEDMVNANADYGFTDIFLYNKNERLVDRRIRSYIKQTDKESLFLYHLMYHMTGTDTLMFKKEYIERIGMFPPIDVGDEFFLMEQAILGGGCFCYSPHCYIKAYIHEGNEEGLSSGEGKIKGENGLFEEKKKHFGELQKKDVRYIKVRHHLVIAFAEKRRKNWLSMIKHGAAAVFVSPVDVVNIVRQRV